MNPSQIYIGNKHRSFQSKIDGLHLYQIAALTEMVDTSVEVTEYIYRLELPNQDDTLYLLQEYVRPMTSKAIALIKFLNAEDIRTPFIPRTHPDLQMQTTIAECLLTLIAEMHWLTYRIVWEELVDFFPSKDRSKYELVLDACSQQETLYKNFFLHYFHKNTICSDLETI